MKIQSFLDVPANERVAMDETTSKLFIECTFSELEKNTEFTEDFASKHPIFEILFRRLKSANVTVTIPVAIFVSHLSGGSPGEIVLWAWTLTKLSRQNKCNMESLAYAFPMGFPTEEGSSKIWRAQKGSQHDLKCDNVLDAYKWEELE